MPASRTSETPENVNEHSRNAASWLMLEQPGTRSSDAKSTAGAIRFMSSLDPRWVPGRAAILYESPEVRTVTPRHLSPVPEGRQLKRHGVTHPIDDARVNPGRLRGIARTQDVARTMLSPARESPLPPSIHST